MIDRGPFLKRLEEAGKELGMIRLAIANYLAVPPEVIGGDPGTLDQDRIIAELATRRRRVRDDG